MIFYNQNLISQNAVSSCGCHTCVEI